MDLSIREIETDGDVVELLAATPFGSISVVTAIGRMGDDLVLRGLHIGGPGAGSVGLHTLRELARILGRQWNARRVVVLGAVRTSGARPGHSPRPIIIETGES